MDLKVIIENESKHSNKEIERKSDYIFVISNGNMLHRGVISVILKDLLVDTSKLYLKVEEVLQKEFGKNFTLINLVKNSMV